MSRLTMTISGVLLTIIASVAIAQSIPGHPLHPMAQVEHGGGGGVGSSSSSISAEDGIWLDAAEKVMTSLRSTDRLPDEYLKQMKQKESDLSPKEKFTFRLTILEQLAKVKK